MHHSVPHVFYYIPSEESATGFEIPIDGELRIVKEVSKPVYKVHMYDICVHLMSNLL